MIPFFGNQVLKGRHIKGGVCEPPTERMSLLIQCIIVQVIVGVAGEEAEFVVVAEFCDGKI